MTGAVQLEGKSQEEGRLALYLLGGLSERERERIEEAFFADDEAFEQMLIAEEELIDAYARGELSAEERGRFEAHFLASPRGRERVHFARSLADAVSGARPAQEEAAPQARPSSRRPSLFAGLRALNPALRFALVAVALVAVIGIPWLLFERARMRQELRRLNDESAALRESARELEQRVAAGETRNRELLAQLESAQAARGGRREDETPSQEPPRGGAGNNNVVIARQSPGRQRPPAPAVTNTADATTRSPRGRLHKKDRTAVALTARVSFDLTPGLARGGGANTLAVPGNAAYVLLQLNLDADSAHESYSAVIETASGREVWRADTVKPRGAAGARGAVKLPAVPARDLPPGDYVLLLSGKRPDGRLEGVADYSFKVTKK